MKVLWCSWKDRTHPLSGGAEEYTGNVLDELAAAGHDVTLACAAVAGQPADEHTDRGIRVLRGGGRYNGVYQHARHVYDNGQFDVVVDEINTRPFAAPAWTRSTPVVALAHQTCEEIWHLEMPPGIAHIGEIAAEPFWWRRYRNVPVVTVSASTTVAVQQMGAQHTVNLGEGGVTTVTANPAPRAAAPTIVTLGRMTAMKRPFDVIAAYRQLLTVRPDLQLVMIGGGPQLQHVRDTTADLPGVRITGRIDADERDQLVSSAWVMAAASVREGWGLVVSEAAALGTHTVGYDVPGLTDSIQATGGVLCPPTPGALADALDFHLDRLAARRPTRTGCATWSQIADRWTHVLTAAAAGGTAAEVITAGENATGGTIPPEQRTEQP
jgi:glycosyltransferase involved in cell wall biosynthesis